MRINTYTKRLKGNILHWVKSGNKPKGDIMCFSSPFAFSYYVVSLVRDT